MPLNQVIACYICVLCSYEFQHTVRGTDWFVGTSSERSMDLLSIAAHAPALAGAGTGTAMALHWFELAVLGTARPVFAPTHPVGISHLLADRTPEMRRRVYYTHTHTHTAV